jgi:nitrate reductase alpha subunit
MKHTIARREFLGMLTASGFGALVAAAEGTLGLDAVSNPLAVYPERGWERVYRDLWKYDSKFTFLCAPNDTHNCLLNAYVRDGVIVRIGPTMRYGEATDLAGNRASHRWDPRVCQKGLALTRRFYGDRRVSQCMVRAGFKRWFDAGFPRGKDGLPPREYFNRARDAWLRVSHDEAARIAAAALKNIAETYTGEEGKRRLRAQHYDEVTIEATQGAGTQVLKFRGGMPLLGITRVFGLYRMANSMALLDAHIRKVGPDKALGARGFDNYSWHTDLPPGHPMVTGQQTVEFDLSAVEHCKTAVVWGMNWITTKMPDAHWLTEARLKGVRVVVIACEYSATASKADTVIVVRPGVTSALALGLANVILQEKLYDAAYVRQWTDLPLLVRMDTLKYLRAQDVFGGDPAPLRSLRTLKPGEPEPPAVTHDEMIAPESLRREWGDYVWWDKAANRPRALTRDKVGRNSDVGEALLEGSVEVPLQNGQKVRCRPVFDLVREYAAHFDPKTVEEMTWAPAAAVQALARDIARNPGTTLFAVGMGPNQFFNNDNKDRDIFLLAALTGNVGRIGGNVGSYAGNYRVALFNGAPQYINENPFDIELDPAKPARPRQYWRAESAHYYNHEDHPLRVGNRLLTGSTHLPTPTKALWFANANSILGNVKWHYNTVVNVLPRIEMIAVQEWWWSDLLRMGRYRLRRGLLGGTETPRHDRLGDQSFPPGLPPHPGAASFSDDGRHRSGGSGGLQAVGADRRQAVSGLLEVCPGRSNRGLLAAHPGFFLQHQGLPLLRPGGEGPRGGSGAAEFPHLPQGGGLRTDRRLAALVHQERPAGVLPRGRRVHRGRRESASPSRAGRLDFLRAQCHRGAETRGVTSRLPGILRRGAQ